MPESASGHDSVSQPGRPPALGILMLETHFPRPRGDIGNPASFDFPVRHAVVAGASPQRVVRERAHDLLESFISAGRTLVAQGCAGIGTSCGFLVLFQQALSEALPVPVMTSSLLQIATLDRALGPEGRTGVITIAADRLDAACLAAAGARHDTPLEGVEPGCEFAQRILTNDSVLDLAQAERDVVAAACRLVARCPEVHALVLECTNMPPYRAAVASATGLPVFDAQTALIAFWKSLGAAGAPARIRPD